MNKKLLVLLTLFLATGSVCAFDQGEAQELKELNQEIFALRKDLEKVNVLLMAICAVQEPGFTTGQILYHTRLKKFFVEGNEKIFVINCYLNAKDIDVFELELGVFMNTREPEELRALWCRMFPNVPFLRPVKKALIDYKEDLESRLVQALKKREVFLSF